MTKSILLTIFTPTYNRAHFLNRLYESLERQTDFDFEWIVVDDGSSDNTPSLMKELCSMESAFPIKYFQINNGGKHRAINKGVKEASGKWFLILDSDDWLSNDAVALIKRRITTIENDDRFCGIAGLRVTPELKTIGNECYYETLDTTFFDYRFKLKIHGDRAEIIKTDIMREYPFPEFESEKFLGEAIIWNSMSSQYLTRFTNDKFYICEYQPGGLTDTFNKKMDENPFGAMLNQLSIINHKNCPLEFWLFANFKYWHYWKIAKRLKQSIPSNLNPTVTMKIFSLFNPIICNTVKLRKRIKYK